jgi:hypothetical protein
MSNLVMELFEKAKQLSVDERIELADLLSMSKMVPEAEWQRIWAVEARCLIEAYERGEAEVEDFDVVIGRMRKEFLD